MNKEQVNQRKQIQLLDTEKVVSEIKNQVERLNNRLNTTKETISRSKK